MKSVLPPSNFSTGMDVEEQSLTWTVQNFPVVRKHKSLIDSQKVSFSAGSTLGPSSNWSVFLLENMKEGKRWIGIFLKLDSPTPTDATLGTTYSQIRCTIWNRKGKRAKIIMDRDTGPLHIATTFEPSLQIPNWGWGFDKFIDADDAKFCPEESLAIEMTFKLHTPSTLKSTNSLEDTMTKFQATFLDQLRKDLSGLRSNPIPCTDIKIISNDKKEFSVQRRVLAVRSEVFAAMLGSDMIEANSGVIELPDISSTALDVLLNFFYTGELLPAWKETEVIVELTNAAAKYQLQDLLQFLDAAMGKVCQLQNVGALATLARQLSLKVAEEELLSFLRKEGYISLDNFLLMWNAELPVSDDDADEPQTKKQKLT